MQTAFVVARTLHFWSVALLLGGAGFVLARRESRLRTVLRVAAVAAAISGVAWFACVFISVMGDVAAFADPDSWSAFIAAPFGWPWMFRLGLCVAALAVAVWPRLWAAFAVGLCLAINQAWLGHAANGTGVLPFAIYWLHVVNGFAWVGALLALCYLSIEERRVPTDALALFSTLGIIVVAIITVTGCINAVLRGIDLDTLIGSAYGRILSTKILLFVGMLGFAAYNRLWLPNREMKRLPVSFVSETFLGLMVLAVAAILGITPPP